MIIKENIFIEKSEDEIDDMYFKKYHGKFFRLLNSLQKKIFFANDIFINEKNGEYYIELKVLTNNGNWIGSNDVLLIDFHHKYDEINIDEKIDALEKEKESINIKIKALLKKAKKI